MEKELYVKQLKPYLYLLDEAHEATGYLVVGDEKACVIDTMNGYNNLYEAVKKITDKPIIVVNTHGHPDHIFGNVYFDEAYLNPKDYELASQFTKDPEFLANCEREGYKMPPFRPIQGGDVIELGGKTLEIYELSGHTPGGILLLFKEDRILFTGDAVNHHLWMQLDGCPKMTAFLEALDKVMFLEKEADLILHGHAQDYDDISLLRCLRQGVLEICNGKTGNDKPYQWFGGKDLQHPFRLEEGKHYSQIDSVICYRKEQIEQASDTALYRYAIETAKEDLEVLFASNLVECFCHTDITKLTEELRGELKKKGFSLPTVHFRDNALLKDGDYLICERQSLLRKGHIDLAFESRVDSIWEEMYHIFGEKQ